MKAAIIQALHKPVSVIEVEKPVAQPGEAVIKISHAALNHRDVWITKGQYAGITLPVIPGSDGCGVVVELGSTEDSVWMGKEVIIQPGKDWGPLQSHQDIKYSILGMPENGTIAEYVKVSVNQLFPKPPHLSRAEAAAIPLAGLTAYRALMVQGAAQKGQRVLITGMGGGVAQWAGILAIAAGCEVWGTSGNAEKCAQALTLGISGCVNYQDPDGFKELKRRAGAFDLIIDSACGNSFGKLAELCKPGGSIVIYGGTAGNISELIPAKIFWKQIKIIGSTMGSNQDFSQLCQMIENYKIKPMISHVFSLNQVQEAFELMARSGQFGKIIIAIE